MMETTAATAANDDNAPTLFNEDALVVLLLLGGLLLGVPSPASGLPPDPTDDGVCTCSSNGRNGSVCH